MTKNITKISAIAGLVIFTVLSFGAALNIARASTMLPLTCSASSASVNVGQNVTFTPVGGVDAYNWTGGGNPPSLANARNVFVTNYSTPGYKTVTVVSGTQTAICSVNVIEATPPALTCSPSNRNVNVGQNANFSAQGGFGNYAWNGGGSPANGSGTNFSTSFSTPGTKTVTVISAGLTQTISATCSVNVVDPTPACDNNSTNGHIISVGGNGSPATASITNAANGCSKQVTFASYKMFVPTGQPGWLDTQILFDYGTITIGPGETRTITIGTPGCKTQLDIYEGPVQPHLSDVSGGFPGQVLLDWNINNSNLCTNATPLTCSPANQNVNVNQNANFSASGGTGTYSWSGGGNPSSGTGSNFSINYSTSGSKTVTVFSGNQSANCQVNVTPLVIPQLICSPANQTGNINDTMSFSAQGGNGSYSWSGGGNPSTGSGAGFSTAYSTSGNKTVMVTSGSQTATCAVHINTPPPQLSCNPSTQTISVNGQVNFSASGGAGTYSWTTNGSPSFGNGVNFSSSYSIPGTHTATVTDGSQTATCSVIVNQLPTLTCSPANQTGNINDTMSFSAAGGTGTYSWSVSDGSPSFGGGSNFSSVFSTAGNKTVTVQSGSQTATCQVSINQPVCNAPDAWLNAVTNISANSATLNAYVDPHSAQTTYYFEYGQTNSFGYTSQTQTITSAQNIFATIYNLQPGITYYFRLVAQNNCGINRTTTFSFITTNNPPQQQPITCSPQNQNVNINDWVNFYAQGGSGNYYWSASQDASPYFGNGQNFGTRFSTNGTKIVTVNSSWGGSAQCVVNVNGNPVNYQSSSFQITKNVLNRTLGQSTYVQNVDAQAQDMVEFEIRVNVQNYNYNNNGNNYGCVWCNNYNSNNNQINLRDNLPPGLTYVQGSTRVNGIQVADGITQGGIYLNSNSGEQVVRFLATINQDQTIGTLTNQAVATLNGNTQNANASVNIRPRGQVLGAADVVTGPEDVWPLAMLLGLLSAAGIYYYFFHRNVQKLNFASVIAAEIPAAPLAAKKSDLQKLLEEIHAKEKKADA